jgi:L-threonine kinase
MAEAKCPASGGELIQGWIAGGEKLVSCPVDWFSTVEVSEQATPGRERPLMRRMLQKVVAHFGHSPDAARTLRIDFHSTIPVGKGFASSTADIAATAVATARQLGESLDEITLATLCTRLEPTDSTVFRLPTLFEHQGAASRIACRPLPPLEMLLLEGRDILLTADYHRLDRQMALQGHASQLEAAWDLFRQGCAKQESRLIGEAATISAIASQQILAKPMFNELLALAEKLDLYGVNVAHSGSLVGLLFDTRRHDAEEIIHALTAMGTARYYPDQHRLSLIAGGVR